MPSDVEDTASRAAVAVCACGAARCKSPLPDGTRVYMDEFTFGVITYAPRSEGKRSVPQLRRWNARNLLRYRQAWYLSPFHSTPVTVCSHTA